MRIGGNVTPKLTEESKATLKEIGGEFLYDKKGKPVAIRHQALPQGAISAVAVKNSKGKLVVTITKKPPPAAQNLLAAGAGANSSAPVNGSPPQALAPGPNSGGSTSNAAAAGTGVSVPQTMTPNVNGSPAQQLTHFGHADQIANRATHHLMARLKAEFPQLEHLSEEQDNRMNEYCVAFHNKVGFKAVELLFLNEHLRMSSDESLADVEKQIMTMADNLIADKVQKFKDLGTTRERDPLLQQPVRIKKDDDTVMKSVPKLRVETDQSLVSANLSLSQEAATIELANYIDTDAMAANFLQSASNGNPMIDELVANWGQEPLPDDVEEIIGVESNVSEETVKANLNALLDELNNSSFGRNVSPIPAKEQSHPGSIVDDNVERRLSSAEKTKQEGSLISPEPVALSRAEADDLFAETMTFSTLPAVSGNPKPPGASGLEKEESSEKPLGPLIAAHRKNSKEHKADISSLAPPPPSDVPPRPVPPPSDSPAPPLPSREALKQAIENGRLQDFQAKTEELVHDFTPQVKERIAEAMQKLSSVNSSLKFLDDAQMQAFISKTELSFKERMASVLDTDFGGQVPGNFATVLDAKAKLTVENAVADWHRAIGAVPIG